MLPWAWQEIKGGAIPINEAAYPGAIEDCRAGWEATMIWSGYGCDEVVLLHPRRKWRAIVWAVWQKGREGFVCVLALRKPRG